VIEAIIFDCFGVLTTETWLAFIDSLPERTDVDAVRQVRRAYTSGQISKQACVRQIKELTGRVFTEAEDQEEVARNTIVLAYIRELRGRGYKIGLLSNIASNWIRDSFLSPQEQALFDDMTLSFEVGIVKPDPRIFELACKRLGVDMNQTVLVDDIERYCMAAKEVGMAAVLYKDFKQFKADLESILRAT